MMAEYSKGSDYESYDPYFYHIQIDKTDDTHIRIVEFETNGVSYIQGSDLIDFSEARIIGIIENVECTDLMGNREVMLHDMSNFPDIGKSYAAFIGRNMLRATNTIFPLKKMDVSNYDIEKNILALKQATVDLQKEQ